MQKNIRMAVRPAKWPGFARYQFTIIFLLAAAVISVFPAKAAEGETEKVRIGYYEGDPAFQDGFSEGERKTGYAYEYYQELAMLTGWDYEYVYGSREEIFDRLLAGEVDIMAGVSESEERPGEIFLSQYDMGLEQEENYFAVNGNRADLKDELNRAQGKILASLPDFTVMLRQKYYSKNARRQLLSEEEKEWLAKAGSLNVGYVRHNLPLSDQLEDGTPVGVAGEMIPLVSDYLGIPLNPICYENASLMEQGLRDGEIDAAFPVYSDLWITEQKGFYQTDSFISDRVMIVYEGNYRDDLMDRIALSETGVGQRYYLSIYYPESATIFYENREKAFTAIKAGEVNCMIGCSSILQKFLLDHKEYQNMNIAYLDTSENFSIAVNKEESQLAVIMDKAVHHVDDAEITSAMIKYSGVEENFTLADFIRRYAVLLVMILCIFFTILLWTFVNYRRKTAQFNAEQARTRTALETALGAANAASVAKTTFLSNMSHDIRTPLNGIIGMTAIATAHVEDTARVKDCLGKITASGKHLLALINEVLDMSKIESGTVRLNEERFDLSELIDDLIVLNKQQAEAKNHEMVVHILNVSHEEVIGDSLRLQQIFTNLVSNAIKYTPDGGKIRITLSEKPSGNPNMGCFEFIVKDNGVGMSKEYLPHIFDAFTRAENAMLSPVQGTGLGMAIARNIARMMDGDITVESTLGEGSTFTVLFYLKLVNKDNVPYEDFVGLKVLVVDDDPVIRESACLLLSELGMQGEGAASCGEALEHVEALHQKGEDYFIVLTDWKMPGMDGVTTTRELRKKLGKNVPIIIISAYDWSAIEAEALRAGADGFLGKPLFKSRLVHLFEQRLGIKTEKAETGLKEMTMQADFSGNRVLLAEDNEINAEIATEILGMAGLSVEWAHNGKEAVHKMETSAPGYYDCIFMDIQMPVMNGLDAARAIRALPHPDARIIPIFAMTANAFTEDVQDALKAGMNEHIAKPLNVDRLLVVLSNYLKPKGEHQEAK